MLSLVAFRKGGARVGKHFLNKKISHCLPHKPGHPWWSPNFISPFHRRVLGRDHEVLKLAPRNKRQRESKRTRCENGRVCCSAAAVAFTSQTLDAGWDVGEVSRGPNCVKLLMFNQASLPRDSRWLRNAPMGRNTKHISLDRVNHLVPQSEGQIPVAAEQICRSIELDCAVSGTRLSVSRSHAHTHTHTHGYRIWRLAIGFDICLSVSVSVSCQYRSGQQHRQWSHRSPLVPWPLRLDGWLHQLHLQLRSPFAGRKPPRA